MPETSLSLLQALAKSARVLGPRVLRSPLTVGELETLFADEVFEEFYWAARGRAIHPAWVNKLVAAEYEAYFRLVGFAIESIGFTLRPFDEPFYARFEEKLGRYPRLDLQRDFIIAVLRRPP